MQTRPPSTEAIRGLISRKDSRCVEYAKRRSRARPSRTIYPVWAQVDREGTIWFYDPYEANRVVRWIETFCRHKKGEFAGQPFILAPWQKRLVRELFGWFGVNGLRKYREAWIEVPRKNGKSTLVAAIALYLTIGDHEPAAEVYSVAGSHDQAALVYSDSCAMVDMDASLSDQVDWSSKGLVHHKSMSRFKALGKGTQHGLNPHGVIGDEVHEWKGRDQYEAVTSADGARRQPMMIFITTAGYDITSLCGELHRNALNVRDGVIYRPDLYVAIYAAESTDDWSDEAVWMRANPGLVHGAPKIEALRNAHRKALQSAAEENTFKRLRLNIWTDSQTAWISRSDWMACRKDVDWQALRGSACYAGIDVAKVHDMSALVLLFPPQNPVYPGRWILGGRFWCPLDNIEQRSRDDGIDYQSWHKRGMLSATPGNTTDFDQIENDIRQIGENFDIQAIGFDPHLMHQMAQHLIQDGIDCVEVRQGMLTLAAPTMEFQRKVLARELVHGGHEVMGWHVANVVVQPDSAGNIKPHKGKSVNKIDGVAAAINGLAIAMDMYQSSNLDDFLSRPVSTFGGRGQ